MFPHYNRPDRRHYISELVLETDVKDEYMIIGRFEIIAILYTSFSVTSERGRVCKIKCHDFVIE
jgi:hypothetical protein